MNTTTLVTIVALGVLLLIAVVVLIATRKRRSAELRDSFGPEYDRTVEHAGRRRDAERELAARKDEHDQLELRPLTPAARERYLGSWTATQSRFVDAPVEALAEADSLVTQLMAERGYPTEDFDSQARLLSVEHAAVLASYRGAHDVERASRAGNADTESVRRAMLDFRRVFEDLIGDGAPASAERVEPAAPVQREALVQREAPVQPVDRVGPADRLEPAAPVRQAEHVQPVEVEPAAPVEQAEPVQQADRAEPLDPADPVDPYPPADRTLGTADRVVRPPSPR